MCGLAFAKQKDLLGFWSPALPHPPIFSGTDYGSTNGGEGGPIAMREAMGRR